MIARGVLAGTLLTAACAASGGRVPQSSPHATRYVFPATLSPGTLICAADPMGILDPACVTLQDFRRYVRGLARADRGRPSEDSLARPRACHAD